MNGELDCSAEQPGPYFPPPPTPPPAPIGDDGGTIDPEEQCEIDALASKNSCELNVSTVKYGSVALCMGFIEAPPVAAVCIAAADGAYQRAMGDCSLEYERDKALCD